MPKRFKPLTYYFKQGLPTECWIWKGHKNKGGYGTYGRSLKAHRYIYELFKGKIPAKMHIDHIKEKCNNRACVNPDHLEPVTQAENNRRGNKTKLTREQVLEIREALKNGKTQNELAALYNVTSENIHM